MSTDAELVERYLGGDRQALADIYERYADRVHDLCVAMLGAHDDAADAFQGTFLVAARRLEGLRDRSRLRAWLYAIARNQCRARIRTRARTRPALSAFMASGSSTGPRTITWADVIRPSSGNRSSNSTSASLSSVRSGTNSSTMSTAGSVSSIPPPRINDATTMVATTARGRAATREPHQRTAQR